MANEIRRRANFQSGTIDDNPLSNSATTLNSTELAGLQAISSSEYAVLVLDPTGAGNGPEVVYVTAHTGSATSATIVRGREGTSGVSHASTITWVHVATANDFPVIGDNNDQPSTGGLPYESQEYVDTTNDRIERYTGSAWARTGWYSSSGRTGGTWTRTANQAISSGTNTAISWDTETFDSDGFCAPTSSTITIPSGQGGLYAVTVRVTHAWQNNGALEGLQLVFSNAGTYSSEGDANNAIAKQLSVSVVLPLAAAETITTNYLQGTGGAQNVTGRIDVYRIGA